MRGVQRRGERSIERRKEEGVRGEEREERCTRDAVVCYITLVSSNTILFIELFIELAID